MDEEQKDKTANNLDDVIIPPVSTTEYVDEPTTDIPSPDTGQSDCKKINKEPVQVNVNISKDDKREAGVANKIAIGGLIINLVLAFVTYMLFQKTVEANKTSQNSLAEAQKAVTEAKRANDIAEANFKLAQSSSASSDSISNIGLDLTKKSVTTQINSIQLAQKEFEIENRPLLQIGNLVIDTFPKIINDNIFKNRFATANYSIINMGKFPAKVLTGTGDFLYGPDMSIAEIEKKQIISYNSYNASVSNATTLPGTQSVMLANDDIWRQYKEGKLFFYLTG